MKKMSALCPWHVSNTTDRDKFAIEVIFCWPHIRRKKYDHEIISAKKPAGNSLLTYYNCIDREAAIIYFWNKAGGVSTESGIIYRDPSYLIRVMPA